MDMNNDTTNHIEATRKPKEPTTEQCIQALQKHGIYKYDFKSRTHYAFNGKFWSQIDRIIFEKRLIMLLGDNVKRRVREEILATFNAKIADDFLTQFDLPTGIVNLTNGVLNVKTNKLIPHSSSFHFLNVIPIEYNLLAPCERWIKFIDQILLDRPCLKNVIQEMFGYCLIPGNHLQVAFILFGEGENGKSTLLEILRALLGADNTSALSLSDISDKFRRVNLMNKYANICEESPNRAIESDVFKNLVAGGRVTAERKFQAPFDFNNQAKLIFAANSVPIFKDNTHSLHRRLVIIPFDYRVSPAEKDHDLLSKLLLELPGILNWSLAGLERLMANKKVSPSLEADKTRSIFMREGDNVRMFIEEECTIDKEHEVENRTLYSAYNIFCNRYGYRACSDNEFGKRVRRCAPIVERERKSTSTGEGNKRPWILRGIKWNEENSN